MKRDKPGFNVGDYVFTKWNDTPHIVRRVLKIKQGTSESGWMISADGGEPCKCCGRPFAAAVRLDANWFVLVERAPASGPREMGE